MHQQDTNRFRTAHAVRRTGDDAQNAVEAVRAIQDAFAGFNPSLIVFFSSMNYDPGTLAREMKAAFPGTVTMGCTTAGEEIDDRMLENSVVAMAFSPDVFDYCESALVLGAGARPDGTDAFGDPADAMNHIGRKLPAKWIDLDYREYIGFMLGDRISDFSEGVLDRLGEITNAMFVGGFAGDDWRFKDEQRVMYGGKAYADAAILALWKPKRGFGILKTQAANPTGKRVLITRADEKKRVVWELDGEDAAPVYARAMGKSAEDLSLIDFSENPFALTADGEPYLQAVSQPVEGRGLQFLSRVREGTSREIMRAGDIVETTRHDLAAKLGETGDVSAILHINCVSRHNLLKNRRQAEEFGGLFRGIPSVAMSSYGEIWVGVIAQTSTMILFK